MASSSQYDAHDMAREAFITVNAKTKSQTYINPESYFSSPQPNINYTKIARIPKNGPLYVTADGGAAPEVQSCLNGAYLPHHHRTIVSALSSPGKLLSDENRIRHGVIPETVDLIGTTITSQAKCDELVRRCIMTYIRPVGTAFADGLGQRKFDEAGRVNVMDNKDNIAVMVSGTTSVNVMTATELQNDRPIEMVVPVQSEWNNLSTWKLDDVNHINGQITCYFRHDESRGLAEDLKNGFAEYNRYVNTLWDRLLSLSQTEEEIKAAPPILTASAAMSNFIVACGLEGIRLFVSSGMARVVTPTSFRLSGAGGWEVNRTIPMALPPSSADYDVQAAVAHGRGTLSMNGAPSLITIAPIIRKPEFRTGNGKVDGMNILTQLAKAFRLGGRSQPLPKMTPELFSNGISAGSEVEKKAAFMFMRDVILALSGYSRSMLGNASERMLHRFGSKVLADGSVVNDDYYVSPQGERIPDMQADVIGTGNARYEVLHEFYKSFELFMTQISGGADVKAIKSVVQDRTEIIARF